MTDGHFFVLLPSNASLDLYKDNTLTSYTVQLPERILLNGEYEVGLQSIIWSKTYYNVPDEISRIEYIGPDKIPDSVHIQPGNYSTMQILINAINKKMKERLGENIKLTYNEISEQVQVDVKSGYKLVLYKQLSQMLGFGGKDITISSKKTGPYVCDINGGIECLYIYASILDYQFVGDTKAKLLKVLPATGKYGDTIYNSFDVPTYFPISLSEIQNIRIDILDSAARKVQFKRGRTIVNLHFRKRQLSYLV